jgi:hypothetical protein
MRLPIVMLMVYSVGNFFLTIQWMKKSAILTQMVYLTSLADLTLISILIAALGSYTSNVFVFYFPALLALSVTFPRTVTALYTSGVLAAYAAIWLLDVGSDLDATNGQTLAIRLLMLGAIAFCGSLYQQLEADRRAGKGKMFEIFAVHVPEPRGPAREAPGARLPVGMAPRD